MKQFSIAEVLPAILRNIILIPHQPSAPKGQLRLARPGHVASFSSKGYRNLSTKLQDTCKLSNVETRPPNRCCYGTWRQSDRQPASQPTIQTMSYRAMSPVSKASSLPDLYTSNQARLAPAAKLHGCSLLSFTRVLSLQSFEAESMLNRGAYYTQ